MALTEEQEAQKRAIYDKIPPRRRKFIERMGYENWDPFITPNDPIDIRRDETNRTPQELMREFLRFKGQEGVNDIYHQGAWEMCLGLFSKNEKARAAFEYAKWYNDLLLREGGKS